MTIKPRQRATSDAQKQQRRTAVLTAAQDLFVKAGFFGVSMSMIAARAGVAKGTVYIYFETKEEVFLELSLQQLESWLSHLRQELEVARKPMENPEFLNLVKKTFTERHSMYRLISLMHLVLEKNVSYDQALNFKRQLAGLMQKVSPLIEQALPYLPAGGGIQTLIEFHCLVLGWSHMTETSPILDQVLENPELQGFKFDMEPALFNSMGLLLDGLKARNS